MKSHNLHISPASIGYAKAINAFTNICNLSCSALSASLIKPAAQYRAMRLSLIFLLSLVLFCCSEGKNAPGLLKVEELASSSPKEALDSLHAIDYDGLSESDKQYYDFLSIKTNDKAFITHTSDSLILNVIENEKNHRGRGRYPEALYYGGRVYHDLGDFPTALNYYQSALEIVDNDDRMLLLKGCILSQIGGVLNSLQLYEQAIPYVEEVIRLDSIAKDSINLMYDLEMLGFLQMHIEKYDLSERTFKSTKALARILGASDSIEHDMYLAAIKYHQNLIDSALALIRPIVKRDSMYARNVALSYACDIYRRANIPDSALMYAHELIRSKDPLNRHNGYQAILSKELIDYAEKDSIIKYVRTYRRLIEEHLKQNGNQAALLQNSLYNYQVHQRQRINAEKDNERLKNLITGILIITLMLLLGLLYLKNRNKSQRLQLHEAIDNVQALRLALEKSDVKSRDSSDSSNDENPGPSPSEQPIENASPNVENLRVRLREELLSLRCQGSKDYSVPQIILESEVYETIMRCISDSRVITDNSPLWNELESVVLAASPKFRHHLHLLTRGKLKQSDFNLALLIKCGIPLTAISSLVGRAKSTIAYRRDTLGHKVFDQKIDNAVIDDIIRLL